LKADNNKKDIENYKSYYMKSKKKFNEVNSMMDNKIDHLGEIYELDLNTNEYQKNINNQNKLVKEEKTYKKFFFGANPLEKIIELRQLWLDFKRQRVNTDDLESNDAKLLNYYNLEVIGSIRSIRRNIDNYLLSVKKHPIFRTNYRYYKDNEQEIDMEMDFHRIKKYLNNNLQVLAEDQSTFNDYEKIIAALKAKVLLERTISKFGTYVFSS